MKNFRLYLGNKCNMNCSYCYETHNKKQEISKEILDKVISYCNNSNEDVMIIFYGGEPTLYMDKIEYVIQNIYNKQVFYSIFTNGTYMKELIKLENKYNIHIQKILSNKTPVDVYSYEDYIIDRYNLILTPETLSYIDNKYLRYLNKSKHIKKVLIALVIESDWNKGDKEMIKDRLNAINNIYLLNKLKFNFLFLNSYIGKNKFANCCLKNTLSISANGDVVLCHRYCHSGVPDDKGLIGNILKEDINILFKKINTIACEINENKECYYFSHKNIDRNELNNILSETNIMYNPKTTQLYKTMARCGCAG